MNRASISLMIFALIASGCSRVEPFGIVDGMSPENCIQITVATPLSTKGELVEDPLDMGSIGLYCAMTGDDEWSKSTEFTKLEDRRFYVSDEGDWQIEGDPEPWGYESLSDKYTFFAYSPHSDDFEGISPRVADGELIIDYVVDPNSENQPDLMYAYPKKNILPQLIGSVPLVFSHTLACVSFGVVSTTDVSITAIDIAGVISDGSLSWDYDLDVPQWSLGRLSDVSFSVEVDDYTLDDDNMAQVNTERGYLMMIPQVLSDGAEVKLTLSDGEQRVLMIPADSEWEAGAKYRYTIKLDDDDCDFIFDSSQISNCYIINPTPEVETIVQIPIEDRINDFWKNYSGDNKKKITKTSTIDEFSVEMIWTDFSSTCGFTYEVLDDDSEGMSVRLTFPPEFQVGNFVFAVEQSDGVSSSSVLWSWHLWFTDYNPTAIAKANRSSIEAGVDRAYVIDGYEGAVHRYKDDSDNELTDDVWSGIYADKFIMDRNIGESNQYASDYGAGSVYYQFGRKDPFPGVGATYASGASQPSLRESSGFNFYQSVEFANDYFIYGTSASANWCGEDSARNVDCIWYDKNILATDYTEGKSIFDPSPLGWRIPVKDTWSSFNNTGSSQTGCNSTKSVGVYNYYSYRNGQEDADIFYDQKVSVVWSANVLNYESGYCFYYSDTEVNTPMSYYVTFGLPVRAIEE